jgi:thioesterase domain-containing protein
MTRDELAADFARRIPLSQAMGLQLLEWSAEAAVLEIPFEPNRNHVDSIFGGSLYAAGALACYALFRAITLENGLGNDQLVIQRGEIVYLAPVRADFKATSRRPAGDAIERFVETYRRHGKARLTLTADLGADGIAGAKFTGDYVLSGGI